MDIDENQSFSSMLNSEYSIYEGFTTPSPNMYVSQDHVGDLAVNKFQGYYEKVGAPSGFSEDDKVDNAKTMYKSIHKTNFPFEHCWKILRFLPKWNDSFATKKPKKSQNKSNATSSPCTPECVVLGESEIQRPIGRKAAKDIEKKRKKLENEHDDGVAILEQMRADQLESKKQRNEHLKEMILLAKERAEREKEKDEREKKREANEKSRYGDTGAGAGAGVGILDECEVKPRIG
ncbi:hypothetical protein POM88_026805 [Heracleum sosnowskyi]|uniref:No apical meristem-associated C-terminal domain-containing protein n=1 Tax=Heracleum sosnowskyi TaxID=360622 RepID=A0AAD8I6Q0_9APIA|nr:hypothetical protein POM88_026805 [Heracleum sosnowskyi]